MEIDFGGADEIRFERRGRAGVITLNRPKALNAVTHAMIRAMARALDAWEADDAIEVVVLKAEGRAFSAGGDIQHIYEVGRAGRPPVDFFADEYRLNARIARFGKPYVSLIDGIVMGGGVGISFHGSHRVMTENAQFAMPEVGIGFFPDVGGSYLLSRLRGSFGMYLGLTGSRIGYGDALWTGLATHAVESARLGELLDELCGEGVPSAALKRLCIEPERQINDAVVHAIAHHFSLDSLPDLLDSLRQSVGPHDSFPSDTLEAMSKKSPTSLHVAFRQIRAGGMLEIDECMQMEFRIVNRMLERHDFYEGIRAAVIDKGSMPQWRPATLEEIDDAAIEAYFAPLGDEELTL